MSAWPTAGSGGAPLPGGEGWPEAPGMAKGGFSPARFEARYTPPTRKTNTVSADGPRREAAAAGLDRSVDGHRLSVLPPAAAGCPGTT